MSLCVLIKDNNDSMDQHDVVTTTRDTGILSEDASFDRSVVKICKGSTNNKSYLIYLTRIITFNIGMLFDKILGKGSAS